MSSRYFSMPLPNGGVASIKASEGRLDLLAGSERVLSLALDNGHYVAEAPLAAALPAEILLPLLAHHFSHGGGQKNCAVVVDCAPAWALAAQRAGAIDNFSVRADGKCVLQAHRETFWQHPLPWLRDASNSQIPLRYTLTNGRRHPQRAPKAGGEVYRRYIPKLDSTFSLRALDMDTDLALFNEWQNRDNVALFWDQRGTPEEHAAYLRELHDDPHTQTLMGCFDDEPFAYFEMYWAKEDRIAPFYDAHDYDRGAHTLIGNRRFQTPLRLKTWLGCLFHYLFLDDPRTQRVVGEPRVDNHRHIENLQREGMAKIREFDFPHKRAALMVMEREVFFSQSPLWD